MASTIQQIETPKCARALDTSGNNRHGQIYSGRALEFDGVTDYLTVTDDVDTIMPHMTIAGTFTVACWINMNSLKDTPVWYATNNTGGGYSNNRMGLTLGNEGEVSFTKYPGVTYTHVSNTATGEPALSVNTWYRVVCVMSSGTQKLYINGIEVTGNGAGDVNKLASVDADKFIIGERNDVYFDGMISDFQSWDAAWSADDVAYDYLNLELLALNRGGTSLTNSNLKLWYPMQDGNRSHQTNILDASNVGLGDELVTNGTFDSDISSWTDYASSFTTETYDNGGLKIVASGGAARMTQEVTGLKSGTTYKFSFDVVSRTGNNFVHLGTAAGGAQIASNLGYATAGTHTHFFTSTQTTVHIQLGTVDGTTVVYDNVSLKPVNDKNNATTVFFGDEFITNDPADNRTFDNDAGNWIAHNSTIAWNGSYGASGGGLRVTCNGGGGSSEGTKLTSGNWGSSIVLGRTYLISADIKGHAGELDNFRFTFGNVNSSTFSVTTSFATYTATITPSATTNSLFIIKTNSNTDTNPYYIDNISVKEVGVASGWADADQQLHIPQTTLQSYNELLYFRDQEIDGAETDNVPITVGSNIWNATNGEWNSVSAWVSFTDSFSSGMIWAVDNLNPALHYTYSGSNINIGYNTGNGDIFGVTVLATRLEDKFTHFVMNWKRNSNSDDTAIDSTDVEFFINGEKQTCSYVVGSNSNGCDTAADADLGIGDTESNTVAYSHMGVVTEISAWTYQLTSADVRELYNDGKALDALTHSKVAYLTGYWRNNGLSVWKDLVASNNGTPSSTCQETMIIPQGLDSRDSQGFIMNRQRNTSSLNLVNQGSTTSNDLPYVDLVDTTTIADGSAISFTAWLKPEHVDTQYFLSKGFTTDYIKIHDATTIILRANNVSESFTVGTITPGDWIHIAIVKAANDIVSVYINGVLNGTASTDTEDLEDVEFDYRYIGGHVDNNSFNGEIDGFLIHNDELTQAEVLRNYNATKGSHRN